MIKHFGIYPTGFDKDNLFEDQKIFLIYLMGLVPSLDDWTIQMDYKTKLQDIKDINKIELSKTDIDVCKMQNKNISELRKERLYQEKETLIKELNDKFGIKNEVEEIKIEGLPDIKNPKTHQEKMWDLLQGKINGL